MQISAIVAMSENHVIGKDNKLPWYLPADLKHFKNITLGKPIIMGRKTFESIGKALPDRCNVVVTHDVNFSAPGCIVAYSIETALHAVDYSNEVFIIGGSALFEQLLPQINKLYLTILHHEFEGDTFFPVLDYNEWHEVERVRHEADAANVHAYSFVIL